MTRERVQKVLAAAGHGSRRTAEGLVAEGRVSINGVVATLGDKADPSSDVIAVDGKRVHVNTDLVHLLLNKPIGVVSTASDPQGRPTVTELVPPSPRLFSVGRLDQDTSGLLVMTNDGELAHRLAHPSYRVEKTYMAQIRGPVSKKAMLALTEGVELDDGVAKAVRVNLKIADQTRSLLEVVMTEGRKREVRRMLAAVGLQLEALVRTKLGPLQLGNIKQGKARPLNSAEIEALYSVVGLDARPDVESRRDDTVSEQA